MAILFKFESLDDMAGYFDKLADDAIRRSQNATRQRDKILEAREAYVWTTAAHTVRNCTVGTY